MKEKGEEEVEQALPSVRMYISPMVSVAMSLRGVPLNPPASWLCVRFFKLVGLLRVVLVTIKPSAPLPWGGHRSFLYAMIDVDHLLSVLSRHQQYLSYLWWRDLGLF